MSTKQFNVHRVTITRGLDKIAQDVTDYQLAILARQHNPENIEVVERDVSVVDVPDDAVQVYAQLQRRYDTASKQVVDKAFPSAAALAQATGLALDSNPLAIAAGAPKSVQRDASAAEKKAAAKANAKGSKKG